MSQMQDTANETEGSIPTVYDRSRKQSSMGDDFSRQIVDNKQFTII